MSPTKSLFLRAATAAALAMAALSATAARADQIELENGSVLHGRVLPGQTSDDGLAVELFETGGVLIVKWDHIESGRRRALRLNTGIETEEGGEILVGGHQILLSNGTKEIGVVLNESQKDQPLKLKTANAVKEYPRDQVQGMTAIQIPGLLVYTPAELYQKRRDENPPDSARAHRDLAIEAMQIGALPQAREHLDFAKNDPDFSKSAEGRGLDGLYRQLDLLQKSEGARRKKTEITFSMRQNRWNEAKTKLEELEKTYTDESVLKAINYSVLENSVLSGRIKWFQTKVPKSVHDTMIRMVAAKAKETKPLKVDENQRGAVKGSLSAARQWLSREFPKELWDVVMKDLGLNQEEMDGFWKTRSKKTSYNAHYGTGSFIVIKKAQAPGTGSASGRNDPNKPKRPAGSDRGSQGGPPKPTKEDKPKTEEEWWDSLSERTGDRAKFLVAYFAEHGGWWEAVRADDATICDGCGGKGVLTSQSTQGGESTSVCTACNGSGKFRKVTYQ